MRTYLSGVRMMLRQPLIALFLVFILPVYLDAQDMEDSAPPTASSDAFQPAISVGLNSGTHAIWGVDVTLGLVEAVNFRLAYNRIRANLSDFSVDAESLGINNQSLLLDADMDLSTFSLLVDWPFTRNKRFRLMAGAMFELNNFITLDGRFSESLFINDYELTPDRLGRVTTTYQTESLIYPYLGLGFGRSLMANRITFAFEAGVYLRGQPQISVASTGVLAGNEGVGPVLSDNLSSLQWHPSVGFRLGYSFGLKKQPVDSTRLAEMPAQPQEDRGLTEETPQEVAPQEVPVPVSPKTPFLSFKGQVLDAATAEPVPYVELELFKILDNGTRQKALTQRYPGGNFRIDLERGARYELTLSHYEYMDKTVTIEADSDPNSVEVMKSYTLNKK